MGLEMEFRKFPPFDRRKTKRTPVHDGLYLDYNDGSEGGSARGENLSEGGLCFASSSYLPQNTSIDLKLRLSPYYGKDKSVKVRARVVHCEKRPSHQHYRVGAAFDPVDGASRHEIHAFLQWLRTRSSVLH